MNTTGLINVNCLKSGGGIFECKEEFRCHFVARYDTVAPSAEVIAAIKEGFDQSEENLSDVIQAAATQTYVCDVCVACGKVVVRP